MRTGLAMIAVVSCGLGATANAADYPKRKAGLWELSMSSSDPKISPRTEQICLDAETDALLYKVVEGAAGKSCSKLDVQSAGGKVVVDSICPLGGSRMTSHNVISFKGDSAYHEDISIRYNPPLFGKSKTQSTHDAKWIGSCTSGMRPGDIVVKPSPALPTGVRLKIREMVK